MSFRDYVNVLRERWLLVLLGLTMGLGGGAAFAFLSSPQYSASTIFFISTPDLGKDVNQAYQGSLLSEQKIKSYAELATGRRIREQVSQDLGTAIGPGVISASSRPDTVLLTLRATDPSPEQAQRIVNLAATHFTALVSEVERPAGNAEPLVVARQVQAAQLPTTPISPRKTLDLILGGLLGLAAGVALAIARHTLDRSIKASDLLADLVGAPVLGETPHDPKIRSRPLIVHDEPHAPMAEACRQLRTNLEYIDLDHTNKSIVITSALPEEGKTTTACNLAIALAQAGNRVALVEADLRRPRAAEYLGLDNTVGLTTVLTGQVGLNQAIQPWGDGLFDFLGSGALPPNPSELLASKQMAVVLEELNRRYNIVLFDAPPTLPVADAAALAANCHGVLLIARYGHLRAEQVTATAEAMRRVSAPIFGVVMTMTPRPTGRDRYGYHYGYARAGTTEAVPAVPVTRSSSGAHAGPRATPPSRPVPMTRFGNGSESTVPRLEEHERNGTPQSRRVHHGPDSH